MTPPRTKLCLLGGPESINQGEVGQAGSDLLRVPGGGPFCVGPLLIDPSLCSFAALPPSLTLANESLLSV